MTISSTCLLEAFTCVDPKVQKDSQVISHFALLGSACTKAAFKMLVKLTPVVNFTNILWAAFSPKNYKAKLKIEKSWQNTFIQKSAHKMLVKLTTDLFAS